MERERQKEIEKELERKRKNLLMGPITVIYFLLFQPIGILLQKLGYTAKICAAPFHKATSNTHNLLTLKAE